MSARVLRRFIILMVVFMFVAMIGTDVFRQYFQTPPGNYQTELGGLRLEDKKYDEAIEHYDKALEEAPGHRGAMMGKALVYLQSDRYPEAVAHFTQLINHLTERLKEDNDETDRGVLAAAYANRGIAHDRAGAHKKALDDYIDSLKVDYDAVEGPGVVHKILYGNQRLSTVRERAKYLYEQFQKPEDERLLRVPELDAKQRMYKP